MLSRRAVGEHAHGIDGLLGASSGDYHPATLRGSMTGEQVADVPEEIIRLSHAPTCFQPGSEMTDLRTDDDRPAAAQTFQVFLGGSMVEHAPIHGRGHQEWTVSTARTEGKPSQDEQVICDPMCKFGDGIGSGRCDDEQIGGMTQPDMQDVSLRTPQGFIGESWSPGDGLEGEWRDEFESQPG